METTPEMEGTEEAVAKTQDRTEKTLQATETIPTLMEREMEGAPTIIQAAAAQMDKIAEKMKGIAGLEMMDQTVKEGKAKEKATKMEIPPQKVTVVKAKAKARMTGPEKMEEDLAAETTGVEEEASMAVAMAVAVGVGVGVGVMETPFQKMKTAAEAVAVVGLKKTAMEATGVLQAAEGAVRGLLALGVARVARARRGTSSRRRGRCSRAW